ncbi:MAG: DUF6677 family protein [Planctomycetota bacterium]
MKSAQDATGKMIGAGLLTWLLPGAGHFILGHRGLGIVFFLGISIPYALGLAVGGVKNCVNPWSNKWLFLAEMGAGGYTTLGFVVNQQVGDLDPRLLADPKYLNTVADEDRQHYLKYMSFYPESDVAQIYLATAGLLNILAILDALMRAQTGGLPTFYRALRREDQELAGDGK